jgi:hypothetical protein
MLAPFYRRCFTIVIKEKPEEKDGKRRKKA